MQQRFVKVALFCTISIVFIWMLCGYQRVAHLNILNFLVPFFFDMQHTHPRSHHGSNPSPYFASEKVHTISTKRLVVSAI